MENRHKKCWDEGIFRSLLIIVCLVILSPIGLNILDSDNGIFISTAWAETDASKAIQLKAAFIYNFMKFIDWPDGRISPDKTQPVVLSILGDEAFGDELHILSERTIKDHPIKVLGIKGFAAFKKNNNKATFEEYFKQKAKEIESCHVLYIAFSEAEYIADIIRATDKLVVLTISDIEDFAVQGGIVEFTEENNRMRFDINCDMAEKKELKINSQLLKLARKVIKKRAE